MAANLMKRHYLTWNRDTVADDFIINQLRELSENRLRVPLGTPLIATAEVVSTAKPVLKPQKHNKKKKKRN
jgi:hypothetical protein